ncbi:hypothetical protein M8J77_003438 [Diaphorina citri]|nr:hypothetical protein M8J77_003438 [Diaphorina citri]
MNTRISKSKSRKEQDCEKQCQRTSENRENQCRKISENRETQCRKNCENQPQKMSENHEIQKLYKKAGKLTALRHRMEEHMRLKDHEIRELNRYKRMLEQELSICQTRNKVLQEKVQKKKHDTTDQHKKMIERNEQLQECINQLENTVETIKKENIILKQDLDASKHVWEKIFRTLDEIRYKVSRCRAITRKTEAQNYELKEHLQELKSLREKDKVNLKKLEENLYKSEREKSKLNEENIVLKKKLQQINEKYMFSKKYLKELKTKLNNEYKNCDVDDNLLNSDDIKQWVPGGIDSNDRRRHRAPTTYCNGNNRDMRQPTPYCNGNNRDMRQPTPYCDGNNRDMGQPSLFKNKGKKSRYTDQLRCIY